MATVLFCTHRSHFIELFFCGTLAVQLITKPHPGHCSSLLNPSIHLLLASTTIAKRLLPIIAIRHNCSDCCMCLLLLNISKPSQHMSHLEEAADRDSNSTNCNPPALARCMFRNPCTNPPTYGHRSRPFHPIDPLLSICHEHYSNYHQVPQPTTTTIIRISNNTRNKRALLCNYIDGTTTTATVVAVSGDLRSVCSAFETLCRPQEQQHQPRVSSVDEEEEGARGK